jgi:hypothetical protein
MVSATVPPSLPLPAPPPLFYLSDLHLFVLIW